MRRLLLVPLLSLLAGAAHAAGLFGAEVDYRHLGSESRSLGSVCAHARAFAA